METEKYKLKKEARQFFDDKYSEKIYPLKTWNSEGIHINLLDKVSRVFVDYGQKRNESSTDLKSWHGSNKTAEIQFTLCVSEIDYSEYDDLDIPELMDNLQKTVDKFFNQ